MSWNDHYRRRDAIDAVLEHVRRDPEGDLPYDSVADVFTSEAELLQALHYRWLMALTGRVGLAEAEAERDPGIDPADAVAAAWRTTAARHPTLRRVLDTHADHPALRTATEGERRLLAAGTRPVGSHAAAGT